MATSVPHNIRNNVPWDRVKEWKDPTHNTLLVGAVKYFKMMSTEPDYGRVSVSHVMVMDACGSILMDTDVGLPNGVDVRRTASNIKLEIPIAQAVTEWGAGTMLARLLGNENRFVLWSFGLELAALHMAVS